MGQLYAIIDSFLLILLMNGESSSNKFLPVGLISKLLIKNRKMLNIWKAEWWRHVSFEEVSFLPHCTCTEAKLAIKWSVWGRLSCIYILSQ